MSHAIPIAASGALKTSRAMIEPLFRALTPAQFVEQHYLKVPFASQGGCAHLRSLASPEVVEAILQAAEADLFITRQGEWWSGPRPQSANDARALVAAGYNFGVRHAERNHEGLAALAASFARMFAGAVDIQMYWTASKTKGLGWHYDAEDVFVLQTTGAKTWELRKNTVHPWPLIETLPRDMHYEREIMPLMRCELSAGDWLYIPAGYWHSTHAEEESFSLSVGILPPTAIDLLDFLRRELPASLLWRQRFPVMTRWHALTEQERLAQLREITAMLRDDLSARWNDDALLRRFIEARMPAVDG